MPHAGAEEKGWDVFSLEYVVDDPLSTVFTEQAMGKYLRVFNFVAAQAGGALALRDVADDEAQRRGGFAEGGSRGSRRRGALG